MIGSVLLAIAVVLLIVAIRMRRSTGVAWARGELAVTSGWRQIDQPLMSRNHWLVGKLD